MKWSLFHQIGTGGEDSALVRKFVVEQNLSERIEFLNVAYEGAQKTLREKLGRVEAPVLIAGNEILRGSDAIINYLAEALPACPGTMNSGSPAKK